MPAKPTPVEPVEHANTSASLPYATPRFPLPRRAAASSSGWAITHAAENESTGLFVFRVIALILNGLMTGVGLLCLLVCNPCGFVIGTAFGLANLYRLVQGTFDGTQRVISIAVNAFGLLVGALLVSLFVLVDIVPVPVYTNVPADPKMLLKVFVAPFGGLLVIACLTAMLYACIRQSD